MKRRKKQPRSTDQLPALRNADRPTAEPPAPARPETTCPVVGIGASAGGLEAFKKLFAAMPSDSGMAFVLVPHLDPTHESLMVELIAKHTNMPVVEAAEGTRVEANRVYIIPPNKFLAITNGVLVLSKPPQPRSLQTAIDFFFTSLASDQGERSIGIVLSGTSSHGVRGLREIKLVGGMVMAQDPASAEYDQMPRSAIGTGLVDYVLRPEDMPDALVRYLEHPYVNHVAEAATPEKESPEQLNRILALLRAHSKYDFRCYRKNMLMRRVHRRMGLRGIEKMPDYVDRLREDPDEVTALYKDLLIGVTGFFREPEAFEVLEQRVIPELVERKSSEGKEGTPVRVWVPGCATGEEAYSIGILLLERLSTVKKSTSIQIFATDIDEEALATGRAGVYPESIAADLSPERLHRFFTKTDDHHCQVNKRLRELVVFAPQNLIGDAPFSRLDLVSCRNLLIYLEPDVQKKLISLFHFALNPDGYLLLGPSESIGAAADMFEAISKKWRVYRRIGPVRREMFEIPIVLTGEHRLAKPHVEPAARPRMAFAEVMQKALLADFAPASVLINRKYEALCFLGPTTDYLEFPPGEPTRDLLSLARQGLRMKIRTACHESIETNTTATETDARVRRNGAYVPCTVTVRPLSEPKEAEGLLLVTFQDQPRATSAEQPPAAAEESGKAGEAHEAKVVKQLEYELEATRSDLQSTIEELESSNEELKASNEEVMSMNEELQSTNEELETSKEELQSLNEELSTVNHQLQDKLADLDRANSDITNLLNSSDIATVFLDGDLNIRRFTPPATQLLNLIATDVGRPFRDITPNFSDGSLMDDCRTVLEKLNSIEKEIAAPDGRYFLRRVLPYRTDESHIGGVLVTFVDVTPLKRAEASSRLLATVLRAANDAVMVYDFEGEITVWNRGAERMYGYSEAEALGMNIRALMPEEVQAQALEYVERARRGGEIQSVESQRVTKDGRVLDVWLTATRILGENGRPVALSTTERDVTQRKREQKELEALKQDLERRVAERTLELKAREHEFQALADNVPALFSYVLANERYRYVNRRYEETFKRPASQILGGTVKELMGDRYRSLRPYIRRALSGEAVRLENVLELSDGTHTFEVRLVPDVAQSGEVQGFFTLAVDVTEAREREKALRLGRDQLRAIVETAAEAIITISSDGTIRSFNPAAERIFGFTAAEAVGQNVRMLMPSPYREEHDRYLRRFLKTGRPKIIGTTRELTARRKDGSTFPIELSVSSVDHLGFYTGLVRDISERKDAEQRERQHQAELAHVLRVATAGELASGLAHELNQPLGTISNNIQACVSRIRSGRADDKHLLSLLKQSSDEALHAGMIVNSIRDLVEKRPPSYERIDLRVPIRRTIMLLAGEMQRSGIALQIEGTEKAMPVLADGVQIEQVLINLVQNAVESIREAGGKERRLQITLLRPGKGAMEVAVRDTGTGVTKEAVKRLFDPFFSTKPDGLGVGLALCRRIIEAHGGKLWAEPRRGRRRGATFRFTLPTDGGKRSGGGRRPRNK